MRARYALKSGHAVPLGPSDLTINFVDSNGDPADPGFDTVVDPLPIGLPSGGEVVYLTSYTSGATSGTIARAKEGTVASSHTTAEGDPGTVWYQSPVPSDFQSDQIGLVDAGNDYSVNSLTVDQALAEVMSVAAGAAASVDAAWNRHPILVAGTVDETMFRVTGIGSSDAQTVEFRLIDTDGETTVQTLTTVTVPAGDSQTYTPAAFTPVAVTAGQSIQPVRTAGSGSFPRVDVWGLNDADLVTLSGTSVASASWVTSSLASDEAGKVADQPTVRGALSAKVDTSEKGAANGVATLGADGKVPTAQMASVATAGDNVFVADQTARYALTTATAQDGDLVIQEDDGTQWKVKDDTNLGNAAGYTQINSSASVTSVNTQTGAVVLDADDIDDTATTHRFATAAQLTKIDGVETGATADQSAADIRALGFFTTGNDGTGSGLDADMVDGQHASALLARGNHTGTQTLASISDAGTAAAATLLDEDDMASDSPTGVPSQQSTKVYVDAVRTDLDYGVHHINYDAGQWWYRGSAVAARPSNIPAYPDARVLFYSANDATVDQFSDLPFTPSSGDQWEHHGDVTPS